MSLHDEVTALVEQEKLEEALSLIEQRVNDPAKKNEISLLKQRYTTINTESRKGVITNEVKNAKQTKLSYDILAFTREFSRDDQVKREELHKLVNLFISEFKSSMNTSVNESKEVLGYVKNSGDFFGSRKYNFPLDEKSKNEIFAYLQKNWRRLKEVELSGQHAFEKIKSSYDKMVQDFKFHIKQLDKFDRTDKELSKKLSIAIHDLEGMIKMKKEGQNNMNQWWENEKREKLGIFDKKIEGYEIGKEYDVVKEMKIHRVGIVKYYDDLLKYFPLNILETDKLGRIVGELIVTKSEVDHGH